MAVKTVTQSTANATKDSLAYELARIVNQLQAENVDLRARVVELVTLANELKTDLNATLTKLDADAGVTDTDYASLNSTTSPNASQLTAPVPDTISFRETGAPA